MACTTKHRSGRIVYESVRTPMCNISTDSQTLIPAHRLCRRKHFVVGDRRMKTLAPLLGRPALCAVNLLEIDSYAPVTCQLTPPFLDYDCAATFVTSTQSSSRLLSYCLCCTLLIPVERT